MQPLIPQYICPNYPIQQNNQAPIVSAIPDFMNEQESSTTENNYKKDYDHNDNHISSHYRNAEYDSYFK